MSDQSQDGTSKYDIGKIFDGSESMVGVVACGSKVEPVVTPPELWHICVHKWPECQDNVDHVCCPHWGCCLTEESYEKLESLSIAQFANNRLFVVLFLIGCQMQDQGVCCISDDENPLYKGLFRDSSPTSVETVKRIQNMRCKTKNWVSHELYGRGGNSGSAPHTFEIESATDAEILAAFALADAYADEKGTKGPNEFRSLSCACIVNSFFHILVHNSVPRTAPGAILYLAINDPCNPVQVRQRLERGALAWFRTVS
jgi:hypothetical protein